MACYSKKYDIIVVGAGHAGCEAALAAARMGCRVLLTAIDLDKLAAMPCSPSIGGMAKGQLVKEIDAGEILVQKRTPIFPWDREADVAIRAAEAGAQALTEALARIRQGLLGGEAPDLDSGSYFSRPGRKELSIYRRKMRDRSRARTRRRREGRPLDRAD